MVPVIAQTGNFRLLSVVGTVTLYSMNQEGNHFSPDANFVASWDLSHLTK
jgi:hypothetical protein